METVSSSPLPNSWVRVFPLNPSKTFKFPFTPLLIFVLFTLKISSTTSIPSRIAQIPYSKYCNDVVPYSPVPDPKPRDIALQLNNGYFTGGVRDRPELDGNSYRSVSFRSRTVFPTETKGIFKVEGFLTFRGSRIYGFLGGNSTRRGLRIVVRPPRIPVRRNEALFRLHGFWSSASGKMCMVGSGTGVSYLRSLNVVVKLNYPNSSTIVTGLVNGTLQNLESEGSLTNFEPISIMGVSMMGYNYTLIDTENENGGFSSFDSMENVSIGLKSGRMVCSMIRLAGRFELKYMNDCNTVNCNPFSGGDNILPGFISFNEVECSEDGRVRYLLGFSNSSYNGVQFPFDPNTTFVAEGVWDGKKKRLGLVACRILDFNGLVGDCSIRLGLSFPATFSLRNRSIIVGQMWSNSSKNASSYFGRVAFQSPGNKITRLEGLKYEYTENENVRKACVKKMTVEGKGGTYPSGYSSDMRFDMIVRHKKGQLTWGYSSPLSVGDKFYESLSSFARQVETAVQVNHSHSSVLNVSYVMSFTVPPDFKLGGEVPSTRPVEISAEGIYDAKTGLLCMIGCRRLESRKEKLMKNDAFDCEILVNVQYSPLTGKDGGNVKGTIESTRSNSDPLYFERLAFSSSSIYKNQARNSLWRMDLEITMVLISNTLACIFVGLQLFYVKKHPEVLPFISVMMLIFLTLAHMIPLLLNFEALFLANRNRQNVFLGRDGWLEVNEVLVRVIMMIAFLLQFRLLQLTWSARAGDGSQKRLWVSDKNVLYLTLPLYIAGGLIAWFFHPWRKPYQSPLLRRHHLGYQQQYFWGELKSYAGLVLDGFLLPQIVFNLFFDSSERVLAPSFYVGTTVVRLLPHAYDLYRAHSSTWFFDYVYANPRMDYYSTAWDVIIPCGGLLFVFLIYFQQLFGGRCFLPKRFRESSVYEKVPVLSTQ